MRAYEEKARLPGRCDVSAGHHRDRSIIDPSTVQSLTYHKGFFERGQHVGAGALHGVLLAVLDGLLDDLRGGGLRVRAGEVPVGNMWPVPGNVCYRNYGLDKMQADLAIPSITA